MHLIFFTLLLLLAFPSPAATPEELAAWDALYARRAEAAAVKELDDVLTKALKATPEDLEVLWRAARLKQWQADGPVDSRLKKVLGKQVWDLGDRAVKLDPKRVEGHFFAAVGIGLYSQALGVLKALREGLEGKFNERLDEALRIDPAFERGAPWLIKGRYYYELPWPKRDLSKSASFYEKALAKFPENLRAHYYLAETLLADDKAQQAREAIQKVRQGSVVYDPAEGQRVQEWAKTVEAKIEEELK